MKFYIPKIGDAIQLTEPWKFELYAERRNAALGTYFGKEAPHYRGIWVDNAENAEKVRTLQNPYVRTNDFYSKDANGLIDYKTFDKKGYDESKKLHQELYEYQLSQLGAKSLSVELPIGTILTIDRIYIRKGMSNFSSVTFYAKNLEGSGKKGKTKALRFWAKLDDCDNIEFKKIEK